MKTRLKVKQELADLQRLATVASSKLQQATYLFKIVAILDNAKKIQLFSKKEQLYWQVQVKRMVSVR